MTVKSSPIASPSSPVCTCITPTSLAPICPVNLAPRLIRCGAPSSSRPIRRLKNGMSRLPPGPPPSTTTSKAAEPPLAGEVEEEGAVEEEVTLLREEQGKPRQVGLALVDFGLRKVGVDRHDWLSGWA